MEFSEKLQILRKQKGLTQEELAREIYVSRTAVSKWESGRGYPGIDSIKDLAKFFSVTVDELLMGNELLTAVEEDNFNRKNLLISFLFGLLDISMVLLFFLPFFAQKIDGVVYEVSLIKLTALSPYLKICYFALTLSIVVWGLVMILLQSVTNNVWRKIRCKISIALSILTITLFVVSLQVYASILSIIFLSIKLFSFIKK